MQWILFGALFGAALAVTVWSDIGPFGGAAVGALPGILHLLGSLLKQLKALSERVDVLAREQHRLQEHIKTLAPGTKQEPDDDELVFRLDPAPAAEHHPINAPRREAASEARPHPPWPAPAGRALTRIWHFFTTGNVVARLGSVVLFFGLAFLLKLAAERLVFPIEGRLLAVALLGLALLVVGWRLRQRQGYGLILQGAGIGTLYLTTFTALRLYDLLPHGVAFGLMIVLVALSVALALRQDSRALATLGTAGGFLAPILTSSGDGSHVLLFSYYALLNAGIVAIAWYRSWRSLNLLGFVFTFVIGALWGHQAYRPELFATTQPFLALFFVFYLGIAVLFAHRQRPRLKGYIDGTLVFGVPLSGFALQAALVWDFEYGLAYSAAAVAAIYLSLGGLLRQRRLEGLHLLTRVFVTLGGLFATLTIPLAFDPQVTAAAWALEGAALVWLGARQQRRLDRAAGILLQLGAGAAFVMVLDGMNATLPLLNGIFLGAMILSVSGFWSAVSLERSSDTPATVPGPILLGWGLAWWLAAGLGEIDRQLTGDHAWHAAVLFLALSALMLDRLSRQLNWRAGAYPAIGLLPVLGLVVLAFYVGALYSAGYNADLYASITEGHLLSGWGAIAWLAAGAVHLSLLRRRADTWPTRLTSLWHMGGLWLALLLTSYESVWLMTRLGGADSAWAITAWAPAPALALYYLTRARTPAWPVAQVPQAYREQGLVPVAGFLALWILLASLAAADPAPLSYLPLLNPVELAQGGVLLVLLRWWLERWHGRGPFGQPPLLIPAMIGACGFAALNGALARSVHYLAGVPHTPSALFESIWFQSGISILWSALALAAMAFAGRRVNRGLWYVGAGLLGLVVVKLFLIELANTGTVGRTVSFLVVGLLMLLIGFLSPLPPRRAEHLGTEQTSGL